MDTLKKHPSLVAVDCLSDSHKIILKTRQKSFSTSGVGVNVCFTAGIPVGGDKHNSHSKEIRFY